MKILKHGKVEQRKFVCEQCGCEFVASETEMLLTIYGLRQCCPTCYQSLDWDSGVPYGEPTPTKTDMERLELILLIKNFRACGLETADCEADFLIANGVTFREG